MPAKSTVDVAVFDLRGNLVRQLVRRKKLKKGYHVLHWDGKDSNNNTVASGRYICRFWAGDNRSAMGKVFLTKVK